MKKIAIYAVLTIAVSALYSSANPTVQIDDAYRSAQGIVLTHQEARASKATAFAGEARALKVSGDDGWRFYSCTFSYDKQDCERVCADITVGAGFRDTRCEQRIRCTGSSGNSWACMGKIRR